MSQEILIEENVNEPALPRADAQISEGGTGPLELRELIIDVRKTNFTVTAEATLERVMDSYQ